jgi:hypothetical protein
LMIIKIEDQLIIPMLLLVEEATFSSVDRY